MNSLWMARVCSSRGLLFAIFWMVALTGCSFKVLAPPPGIDLSPVNLVDSGKVRLEGAGAVGSAGLFGFDGGSWLARAGYGVNENWTVLLRGSRLQADLDSAWLDRIPTAGGLDLGSVGAGVRYGRSFDPLMWTCGLAVDHEWSNFNVSGMAYTGEFGLGVKTRWVWPFVAIRITKVFPYKRSTVVSSFQDGFSGGYGIDTLELTPTWWMTENVGVAFKPDPAWDFWVTAGLFKAVSETSRDDGIVLGVGISKQF